MKTDFALTGRVFVFLTFLTCQWALIKRSMAFKVRVIIGWRPKSAFTMYFKGT